MKPKPGRKTKVLHLLMLEDEPLDAELEVQVLEGAGYSCRWVLTSTRDEFLSQLDTGTYDLILSDYNLPGFDGLSALRAVRERGLDIPFILVSGAIGEERATDCLKAGATDYVLKTHLTRLAPVVERALAEKVEQLRRKQAEEELRESEERYRFLFDNAPIGISVSSPEGRLEACNDHMIEMMRASSREAAFRFNLRDAYPNSDERTELVKKLKEEGLIRDYETTLKCLDDSLKRVNMTIKRTEVGGKTVFLGVLQDITARKQAKTSCARARSVSGSSWIISWIWPT